MAVPQLTATYNSSSDKQTLSADVSSLPQEGDVKAKTAYLFTLRTNITQMQSDVNTLLTKKMEDEKASSVDGKKDDRDAKAEEMYGEEGGEEDEA